MMQILIYLQNPSTILPRIDFITQYTFLMAVNTEGNRHSSTLQFFPLGLGWSVVQIIQVDNVNIVTFKSEELLIVTVLARPFYKRY